jgi:acetyl/propionyl-CoA carboxylase alpha subunit
VSWSCVCVLDGPPGARSYLPPFPHHTHIHAQIAQAYGATAVHPGYGFLSENEEFCEAVEAAGMAWLGPTAKTMNDFALKHVAREIAKSAGVSLGAGGVGEDVTSCSSLCTAAPPQAAYDAICRVCLLHPRKLGL